MPEFQPALSTFENYIYPDRTGNTVISGGQCEPFYFYLGPTNTIPFVRLEAGGSQKLLTWGEVVEVNPGTTVSVRNVSYMPGDLQVQSGRTPGPVPRRVTIPIDCEFGIRGEEGWVITPKFPCDTRRAVRAYFCYSVDPTPVAEITPGEVMPPGSNAVHSCQLTVKGYFRQHSGRPNAVQQYAYLDRYSFFRAPDEPSVVVPDLVPLGTSLDGNAMRLADVAYAEVVLTPELVVGVVPHMELLDTFYVLEY